MEREKQSFYREGKWYSQSQCPQVTWLVPGHRTQEAPPGQHSKRVFALPQLQYNPANMLVSRTSETAYKIPVQYSSKVENENMTNVLMMW